VAPVEVMRFDDFIDHPFAERPKGLTDREHIL